MSCEVENCPRPDSGERCPFVGCPFHPENYRNRQKEPEELGFFMSVLLDILTLAVMVLAVAVLLGVAS